MYTIGQVSKMFNLPVSTLRYYDKQGLFPHMERTSGARRFSEREIEVLKLIECLKSAGLEIKDIKQFMELVAEGPATYRQRKKIIEETQTRVEDEMLALSRSLDMLKFKSWYYSQAIEDGNEDRLQEMIPDGLPAGIREAYDNSHRSE